MTDQNTKAAAQLIEAERQRQREIEKFDDRQDDSYVRGQLARAAASYALSAATGSAVRPAFWPWDAAAWKPKNARADLVRAGALILAELERLDRAGVGGELSVDPLKPQAFGDPICERDAVLFGVHCEPGARPNYVVASRKGYIRVADATPIVVTCDGGVAAYTNYQRAWAGIGVHPPAPSVHTPKVFMDMFTLALKGEP
jgi:hypothetical protein